MQKEKTNQSIYAKEQTERVIEAIESLSFAINDFKSLQNRDYSEIFMNIFAALNKISYGYQNDGCIDKICKEIRALNKTLIMAALIMGATKNPEETLQKYNNIIDMYLK